MFVMWAQTNLGHEQISGAHSPPAFFDGGWLALEKSNRLLRSERKRVSRMRRHPFPARHFVRKLCAVVSVGISPVKVFVVAFTKPHPYLTRVCAGPGQLCEGDCCRMRWGYPRLRVYKTNQGDLRMRHLGK